MRAGLDTECTRNMFVEEHIGFGYEIIIIGRNNIRALCHSAVDFYSPQPYQCVVTPWCTVHNIRVVKIIGVTPRAVTLKFDSHELRKWCREHNNAIVCRFTRHARTINYPDNLTKIEKLFSSRTSIRRYAREQTQYINVSSSKERHSLYK